MKKTKAVILALMATVLSVGVSSADINLSFDGVTTGGWTATDGNPLVPSTNAGGTGMNGITFEDSILGSAFYYAPNSFITGMDLTGEKLNFNILIEDNSAISVLSDESTFHISDLRINGNFIYGYDIIDEGQLGVLQYVSVDFSDPVFSGIDLTNITELGIRAEYWRTGPDIDPVESHLISVPEPGSLGLVAMGLAGLLLRRRK